MMMMTRMTTRVTRSCGERTTPHRSHFTPNILERSQLFSLSCFLFLITIAFADIFKVNYYHLQWPKMAYDDLTTLWIHSDCILTTFRLHSDYILTTFWLHSNFILTNFWLFLTISEYIWLTDDGGIPIWSC